MLFNLEALISLLLPSVVAAHEARISAKTIADLQEAFNGESNAHHRYTVFAKQADAEGLAQVASLFRAAAKAEQFHARNHAEVIRKFGTDPKFVIETPAVKTTRENLQTAINGEIYERDKMYPTFIEEAKRTKQADAIRTFTYALKTEAEHARLFTDALKNIGKMTAAKTYYVCAVCGYTVEALNFLKCFVCGHSKDDYIPVS